MSVSANLIKFTDIVCIDNVIWKIKTINHQFNLLILKSKQNRRKKKHIKHILYTAILIIRQMNANGIVIEMRKSKRLTTITNGATIRYCLYKCSFFLPFSISRL